MLEEGLVGLRPGLLKKRQPRNENGGGVMNFSWLHHFMGKRKNDNFHDSPSRFQSRVTSQ